MSPRWRFTHWNVSRSPGLQGLTLTFPLPLSVTEIYEFYCCPDKKS